jgi:hypothetical protein
MFVNDLKFGTVETFVLYYPVISLISGVSWELNKLQSRNTGDYLASNPEIPPSRYSQKE